MSYEKLVMEILHSCNQASKDQKYIPREYRELLKAVQAGPLSERLRYETQVEGATKVFLEPVNGKVVL